MLLFYMNNLECRKQKINGKFVCKKTGKEILLVECNNCKYKKYKNAQYSKKIVQKSTLKQRTNKLNKLERNRFSLFTDDLEHCIICGGKKDNLHEVIFGSNRLNSIKYGLVIPVCYKHHLECHKNSQLQHVWKVKAQIDFEKLYPDLDFVKIFGRNYK